MTPGHGFRVQINDGSDAEPRLAGGFSDWAATGLMDQRTLTERLVRVADAGFEFYEGVWTDPDQAADAAAMASEHGLGLVLQAHFAEADELGDVLKVAERLRPLAINAHIRAPWIDELQAARLVDAVTARAESAGVPLLVETHRGTIAQDVVRTLRWADRCTCRFNLDASHWAVAGEMGGGLDDDFLDRIDTVLSRVGMIHGRISSGQQVQVGLRAVAEEVLVSYQKAWAMAMGRWRQSAKPGDVFLFEPELGPPGYALRDGAGQEFTDRWDESLQLLDLARNAWEAVR